MRNRLNELIAAKDGCTGTDLIKLLNISRTQLSTIRTNKDKSISYDKLEKLCEYFQIQPGDFFKK